MTAVEAEEAIAHVLHTLWRDGRGAEADMLLEALSRMCEQDWDIAHHRLALAALKDSAPAKPEHPAWVECKERLPEVGPLMLDNDKQVFFYEQDHYYLSNFSAFRLWWKGHLFDTSEAAYHSEKFPGLLSHQHHIATAPSAHNAFKYAERHKADRRPDWDEIKVGIMLDILRAKTEQHEYVQRKLLQTGDRELIENSWRDDFWGWGEGRNGANMLGKLWMQIRSELRQAAAIA